MKHKGLFLLVLFFLHSVLFSAYNDEIMNQIVDELRDKTVFEILQKQKFNQEISIKIIQYINKRADLDKELYIKLLCNCDPEADGYEDCITQNKDELVNKLSRLFLEDILNLNFKFNQRISGLIINYINNKIGFKDKEPYIKLLVICHPKAVGYEDCITQNKDELVNKLNDLPLENILNTRCILNSNISELIIQYINEKENEDKEPYVKLLVICNPKAKDYGECINNNKEKIITHLRTLSLADILNIRYRLNKDISELIINHINTIREEDKEPYIKLLLKCDPEAVGYGDCIKKHAAEIINKLSNLPLENILNLKCLFNKNVSGLIINYINNKIGFKDKEPYIKLLLKCYPKAVGYEDCITQNKDELVNKLGYVSLENIFNNPHLFDQNFSEEIVNYMIKYSNNNKFKKNYNLLLNLNLEGASEKTMNNYVKLLVKYCNNPLEFYTMAKDYQIKKYYNRPCENVIHNIKQFECFKELKNNRLVDLLSAGLIVIGGAGLAASHWSNIECLKEPSSRKLLKGVFAIGCIGIASVIYHNRKQDNRKQEEQQEIIKKINRNRGIV